MFVVYTDRAQSIRGRAMALYVSSSVSLSFPQLLPVYALSILFPLFTLATVSSPCLQKVSRLSRVTPKMFGYRGVRITNSLILMSSTFLTSLVKVVKIVVVDFGVGSVRFRSVRKFFQHWRTTI